MIVQWSINWTQFYFDQFNTSIDSRNVVGFSAELHSRCNKRHKTSRFAKYQINTNKHGLTRNLTGFWKLSTVSDVVCTDNSRTSSAPAKYWSVAKCRFALFFISPQMKFPKISEIVFFQFSLLWNATWFSYSPVLWNTTSSLFWGTPILALMHWWRNSKIVWSFPSKSTSHKYIYIHVQHGDST